MTVAVLCLQGAFIEHINIMHRLGVDTIELRKTEDLNKNFDALILPGGESTTMGKLLDDFDMKSPLVARIKSGMPVFGTCAGTILLASGITNDERKHFATMDITVERNAYGRQLDSFIATENFADIGKIPMTFIRAPLINKVGEGVEILATVNGVICAAREKNQLVTTFHPELTDNYKVHEYFLSMIS